MRTGVLEQGDRRPWRATRSRTATATLVTVPVVLVALLSPTSRQAHAESPEIGDIMRMFGAMGQMEPELLHVWRGTLIGNEASGHAVFVDPRSMMSTMAEAFGTAIEEGGEIESAPRSLLMAEPMGWDNPFGSVMSGLLGSNLRQAPSVFSLAQTGVEISFDVPGALTPQAVPLIDADGPAPGTGTLGFLTPLGDDNYAGHATGGTLFIDNVEGGIRGRFQANVLYGLHDTNDRDQFGTVEGEFCEVSRDALGPVVENGGDVTWGAVPCRYQIPFDVADHRPVDQQQNVDPGLPRPALSPSIAMLAATTADAAGAQIPAPIDVSFTVPVDLAEVDDHFRIFTMSSAGNELEVDGTLQRTTDRRFRFRPDTGALETGVVYEARIAGGSNGIVSRAGTTMADDRWWHFSTMVDPDEIDPVLFQTARNADLLVGKPTLTRVYVEWEEHPHIDPGWQVETFEALLRARDQDSRRLYPHEADTEFEIRRPDINTDDDRRNAHNTANLFNWLPDDTHASVDLTVEVEPIGQYPDANPPVMFEGERTIDIWTGTPRTLNFDYYPLRLGVWADGIPAEDLGRVHATVRSSEIFSTQNFPVLSTQGRYRSHIQPRFSGSGNPSRILKSLMQSLHDYTIRAGADSDILVGIYPYPFETFGQSLGDIDFHIDAVVDTSPYTHPTVFMPALYNGDIDGTGLVHEFGHALGLHHMPTSASAEQRNQVAATWSTPGSRFPGIEGFRIAPGGESGSNKSHEEGNQEGANNNLLPMMFPVGLAQQDSFILNNYYDLLLDIFENHLQLTEAPTDPAPAETRPYTRLASLSPVLPGNEPGLLVSGRIFSGDGRAEIDGVHRIDRVRAADDGPLTAELIGPAGTVLAAASFAAPGRTSAETLAGGNAGEEVPDFFSLTLPHDPDAVRLVIRDGEQVLADRRRPATPPKLQLSLAANDEDGIDLTWESAGAAPLTHTVFYSPDGSAPWTLLAVDIAETNLTVPPNRVVPGPQPLIRVTANDGFQEVSVDRPIIVEQPPRPLVTLPSGDDAGLRPVIEATFPVAMDADSLPGRFLLEDASGDAVPAGVRYDAGAKRAFLMPAAALDPASAYRAVLRPGVTDAFGNSLSTEVDWTFETGRPDQPSPVRGAFDGVGESRPADPDLAPIVSALPDAANAPGPVSGSNPPGARLTLDGIVYAFAVDRCVLDADQSGVTAIHGTGTDPDSGDEIVTTMRRVRLGEDLMETVVLTTPQGTSLARHTRYAGRWIDRDGRDTGPLVSGNGPWRAEGVMRGAAARPFSFAATCP
ncbi:Ig-like domain-containing protein [Fodinicurvata sp. EGI_FJ10296]|uniref:Ig-like domain-containing protein n=1 Tax=Fodinicurvata sp. EGI_FJ10296 TaxID=3231908 RepID=UPI003453DE78